MMLSIRRKIMDTVLYAKGVTEDKAVMDAELLTLKNNIMSRLSTNFNITTDAEAESVQSLINTLIDTYEQVTEL